METPDYVWGGLLASGFVYEMYTLYTKRDGDTLSETTRKTFRVRTHRAGRWVFALAWTAFSAWYLIHIVNGGR